MMPRISSIFPTVVSRLGASLPSQGQTILDAPCSLQSMRSRFLLFLGCSALLISLVWFSICVALYPLGVEYQVMNSMYESRWSLSTMLLSGISVLVLAVWKYETFYILCGVCSAYNCASCIVVVAIYSMNFHKALYFIHPQISSRMAVFPRRKYLQLCSCMIVVALSALFIGILILGKLKRLASSFYRPLVLHRSLRSYLFVSSVSQLPFVWFSVYVASHVISLQFSYVQQYMIQELLCALILHTIIILQVCASCRSQTDRLTLKLLISLSVCQCVQEIFYTWNSYYISLYIHSSKARLAVGAQTDQYLMAVNFVGHFLRMCLSACTAYRITSFVDLPLANATFTRFELASNVRRALFGLSTLALLFATAHLVMDVCYTLASHIYRTLIAFTGISVFYLILIGAALALFLRTNRIILLIIIFVTAILLMAVSTHALYIYLDISFNNVLLAHLETLGKEKRGPTILHFVEALLALNAFVLCTITLVLVSRLLHIDSVHDRRDGRLRKPLQILFLLGIVQLIFSTLNAIVLVSIKDEARVFQSMLAYGVLDALSAFVLCLAQIYVTRPSNSHLNYGLSALLLLLITETLTTYNYLSSKTTYVQLLIIFNRMFASNRMLGRNRLANLFPNEEVALMVSSHAMQLIQWFLALISLALTALTLELLYEQRRALKDNQSIPVSTTEASSVSNRYSIAFNDPEPSAHSTRRIVEEKRENHSKTSIDNCYDNPIYNEEDKQAAKAEALLEKEKDDHKNASKEEVKKDDEPLIRGEHEQANGGTVE